MPKYIITNGKYYIALNNGKPYLTEEVKAAKRFINITKANHFMDARNHFRPEVSFMLEKSKVILADEISRRRTFTQTERNAIYAKSEGHCCICGKFVKFNEFTVDHIKPLAKGGSNDLENLQCSCKECNLIKHDALPQDLMEKISGIIFYQIERSGKSNIFVRIANHIVNEKLLINQEEK